MIGELPLLDRKGLRNFGLTTGAIVATLFGLLLPWLFDRPIPQWPWILAGVLWLWALLLPSSLQYPYRGWMWVGHVIGWVNTRIILAVVFYTLFTPIAMIIRLLGKDYMARKLDQRMSTYRVRSISQSKEHMKRPF